MKFVKRNVNNSQILCAAIKSGAKLYIGYFDDVTGFHIGVSITHINIERVPPRKSPPLTFFTLLRIFSQPSSRISNQITP